MSGSSPKQLEATACNAQRSTGPQTPSDGIAATGGRGLRTVAVKPFGGWEDMLVQKVTVAHCRRSCLLPPILDTLNILHFENAIELPLNRAIYSLQEHCCFSHPNPWGTAPIE